MAAFVAGRLHCLSTQGKKVPRPYGETLRATKPNELLHFDFLSLPRSENSTCYALVLKDNMSGYVELIECDRATAESANHGLIEWFKRFGVVHMWISDQGPHFTGEVIDRLRHILGAQHHFVTAYSPWANGSVEVVNRLLLRSLKALLSELKMQIKQWPTTLPLVQAAFNGMASHRLGGIAPITAFTGQPGSSQLNAIFPPSFADNCSISWVEEQQQQQHLREVRTALDAIHQQSSASSMRRNTQARGRRANKPGVRMAKFSIGDFVLAATAVKGGNKLALHWRGPKRVVRSLNDYTFEVQDLCAPYNAVVRHTSRLKFYRDSERGVTEDLIAHALHGEGGHLVDKLLECRLGQVAQQWDIHGQWIGLDPEEVSWEPASVIYEDVPQFVRQFVASSPANSLARRMWAILAPEDPIDATEIRQAGRRLRRGRKLSGLYPHPVFMYLGCSGSKDLVCSQ